MFVAMPNGDRLIIEPASQRSLLDVLASLEPIPEGFEQIDDAPPDSVDL